ncbi:MAG: hypothetical protein QHI38_00180 [Armatimonadota bacterium]|nr:hypothetical protein [Armatimonadota bacterium]
MAASRLLSTTVLSTTLLSAHLLFVEVGNASSPVPLSWTKWRVSNMRYCGGKPPQVVFDGTKSIVQLTGNHPCTLSHVVSYADLGRDTFVLRFGRVSPGVRWQVSLLTRGKKPQRYILVSGTGGGTHWVPFATAGLPRWLNAVVEVKLWSDAPATAEIVSWEIRSPGSNPNLSQQTAAYSRLVKANPLERGLVPHWSVSQGAFVCAYNATHPEHYNFWLEDEGEALWSFGNYPEMMRLYGKSLRDFIVRRCRYGAPVRRVNDQPLLAEEPPADGKFAVDTGLLFVEGNLSTNPQISLHHSTYETFGLLARIADFGFQYTDEHGLLRSLSFNRPSAYRIQLDSPRRDAVELMICSRDDRVEGKFRIVVYRGCVRIYASLIGRKRWTRISKTKAMFRLVNCDQYYRSPLNSVKNYGDVTLLWSEQPRLEFCNLVRVSGRAARDCAVERTGANISRVTFAAHLLSSSAFSEIALLHAASRSFAAHLEIYKHIDFDDADISMSFVNSYPLLGLATYCYRFPEDKEARQVADLLMSNYVSARERLRSRELAYLAWALDLLGRSKEAQLVGDLIEHRAATESYTPHDMAGMAIALRRLGRWEAADRICAALDKAWTGVAQPADFLALGAGRSPSLAERCFKQLSAGLRNMVWDSPERLTFHSHTFVEEAASEAQSYMLVVFDLISQTCGGIVPVRLGLEPATEITGLDFDQTSRTCTIWLSNAGEIDVFTRYRVPSRIEWNDCLLDRSKWYYHSASGTVRISGLNGSGRLVIRVEDDQKANEWEPIDYIGLHKLH